MIREYSFVLVPNRKHQSFSQKKKFSQYFKISKLWKEQPRTSNMNPERAALMAGQPMPDMAKKPAQSRTFGSWEQKPGEKMIKPRSRSEKKQLGQKKKRKWTAEKPTNKRAQRAGPRSLKKQGIKTRVPRTPERKAKAAERKEFRLKQQAGASARKVIKTARREGYRVIKRTARPMKGMDVFNCVVRNMRLSFVQSIKQDTDLHSYLWSRRWLREYTMSSMNGSERMQWTFARALALQSRIPKAPRISNHVYLV